GETTKTWTPFFITSVLKDSKNPFIAYLLAVYAVRAGVPLKPFTEEMATIAPLLFNTSSKQYLVAYTAPQKLESITFRNTSRSRSWNTARIDMPALLIKFRTFQNVL